MQGTLTNMGAACCKLFAAANLRIGVIALVAISGAIANSAPCYGEGWLAEGSLGLTRPIPKVSASRNPPSQPKPASLQSGEPMARMRDPEQPRPTQVAPLLTIDTSTHSLTIAQPGQAPLTFKAQGAYALKRGTYTVELKQTNPQWYAPPTYFMRRGLKVPPEGSKARFMGGALGHQAIFFDKQIAIHSGPIWTDEIGGVKISREDMAALFESVTVGAKLEVR